MKKAIKIQVIYEDGSQDVSTGPGAAQIWTWLMSCQTIAHVHGSEYTGPNFTMLDPGDFDEAV